MGRSSRRGGTNLGSSSDRDRKATLQFTLPQGFSDLQYRDGLMACCIVPTDSGFVDTMAVKPGDREVVFGYTIRPRSSRYTYGRPLDHPTANLDLFIANPEVKISSPILETKRPVEIQGRRFLRLFGADLPPGASVTVELHGLPFRPGLFPYFAFGAAALLLLAGLAYPFVRRGRHRPEAAPASEGALEARRQELIAAIADLDDAFEAGRLSPEEYQRLRAEKKQALLDMAERLKGLPRGG